jgi:predicted nucleic acid-binding protein
MIYLDSSALVKLALTEPESAALISYLSERQDQALVSSALHRTEVLRAIWQAEPGALTRGVRLVRRIGRVSLSSEVLDNAATLPPQRLGTADAIHLASALAIRRDLSAFVAYDKRLLDAATEAGLPAVSPA